MLVDIEKFIYNDKIYSKCSDSDKEMIDTCLHGVRQQLETFKDAYRQAQEEIALLKRENKALSDDNEMKCELNEELNKALDKTCEELETFDMTFNNADFDEVKNKEQWKEWSLHNEKI